MIDKGEMLFVVDENNEPVESEPRSIVHKNRLWHRTTGIWVINDKKEILCQKRSLLKDMKPGFWEAFFGGHVSSGQEYLKNAIKELNEELGRSVSENDLIPYKIFKSNKPTHTEFQQVFVCKINGDASSFKFEKEEVDEIKWINLDEIKKILVVKQDPKWVIKPWDKEVVEWIETL